MNNDAALRGRRPPVVLVATANEMSGERFLRALAEERKQIVDALKRAAGEGVCEVVVLENATPDTVMAKFQDAQYRDRVAILHFAGHAGPEGLLLQTIDGGATVADAAGLAAFLGRQRALQLVFLNACSTQVHADALLAAGVNAVIATSRSVDDLVAQKFAALVYRGLGSGAGIQRAFGEAESGVWFAFGAEAQGSTVESLHASANAPSAASRAIVRANALRTTDGRWPWDIYFRPGAKETAGAWNLPAEAKEPTFGLPKLKIGPGTLDEPFRHLKPFSREHAELFFGRGTDIRELYDKVTGASSASVILLYGASGTGKSSLLAAGLLPRLEDEREVRYATRDRELGLLATLAGAVEAASTDAADIARSWRQIEVRCRRPLVVVVDQIEEAYTADRPEGERDEPNATNLEMRAFVAAVAKLFATSDERPVGRLVLGFRKEWLSDVEGLLEASMVGRTEVRLDQLTRDGVIEAIAKPALLPRDRVRTALTIEPGLDVEIADDLLANRAAHVAPLLQIILADMWSVAPCDAEGVVHFDADLYHRVRAQAKELDGFIGARLAEIERRMPLVGTSGLALDYLEWYTTSKGTAAAHTLREERETYSGNAGGTEVTGFAASRVDGLRRLCIELSLLVESDEDLVGVAAEDRFARLAHDTLAPLIRERAARSVLPAQRARRALGAKLEDSGTALVQDGNARRSRSSANDVLSDGDWRVVKAGLGATRTLTPSERLLIERSAVAHRQRRRVRRGVIGTLTVLLGVATFFGIRNRINAANVDSVARAGLAERALDYMPDMSLLMSVSALERAETPEAASSLGHALDATRDFQLLLPIAGLESFWAFTSDSTIAVESEIGQLLEWNIQRRCTGAAPVSRCSPDTLVADRGSFRSSSRYLALSPDGNYVALVEEHGYGVRNTRQRGAPSMELPKGEYDAVWLTDDAQRFVIAQRRQLKEDTTELIVFSRRDVGGLARRYVTPVTLPPSIGITRVSDDGEWALTSTGAGDAYLLKTEPGEPHDMPLDTVWRGVVVQVAPEYKTRMGPPRLTNAVGWRLVGSARMSTTTFGSTGADITGVSRADTSGQLTMMRWQLPKTPPHGIADLPASFTRRWTVTDGENPKIDIHVARDGLHYAIADSARNYVVRDLAADSAFAGQRLVFMHRVSEPDNVVQYSGAFNNVHDPSELSPSGNWLATVHRQREDSFEAVLVLQSTRLPMQSAVVWTVGEKISAASPDGKWLVVERQDTVDRATVVTLLAVPTGAPAMSMRFRLSPRLWFSADGSWLLMADGVTVRRWSLVSRQRDGTLPPPDIFPLPDSTREEFDVATNGGNELRMLEYGNTRLRGWKLHRGGAPTLDSTLIVGMAATRLGSGAGPAERQVFSRWRFDSRQLTPILDAAGNTAVLFDSFTGLIGRVAPPYTQPVDTIGWVKKPRDVVRMMQNGEALVIMRSGFRVETWDLLKKRRLEDWRGSRSAFPGFPVIDSLGMRIASLYQTSRSLSVALDTFPLTLETRLTRACQLVASVEARERWRYTYKEVPLPRRCQQ